MENMVNLDLSNITESLITGILCGLISSLLTLYFSQNHEKRIFRLKELKNSYEKILSTLQAYPDEDFETPHPSATGFLERHKYIVLLANIILPYIDFGLRADLKDKIEQEKRLHDDFTDQYMHNIPITKDGETPAVYAFEEEWMESYNSLRAELITTISTQIEKLLDIKSEV